SKATAGYNSQPGGGPLPNAGGTLNASMKVRLLGYMEQQAMYNAYNFSGPDFNTNSGKTTQANNTVLFTKMSVFLCPSDPNPGDSSTTWNGQTAGNSNYPNNMGMEPNYTGGRLNGPSWYLGGDPYVGNRVSLASVLDGTSNTVAFSEWVKGTS